MSIARSTLRSFSLLAALPLALVARNAAAAPIAIAEVKHEGPVDFEKEILPIFRRNCRRRVDCLRKLGPASAPVSRKAKTSSAEHAAMKQPDDHARAEIQEGVRSADQPAGACTVPRPQQGEPLGLKLHVLHFIAQNLLAKPAQDFGARRLLEGGVVDLGDQLCENEDADRDFQPTPQIA